MLQNAHGSTIHSLEHVSGTVIAVRDGTYFTLRTPDRQIYSIGLLGVVVPQPAVDPRSRQEAEEQKDPRAELGAFILSNEVDVALISLDAQHRGLGIVYDGKTNVNAQLVETGAVQLNRDYIKTLPLFEQYHLIRADRRAARHEKPAETKR